MTFLAWDISLRITRRYQISRAVRFRQLVRTSIDAAFTVFMRVPNNCYLEHISAFGLLLLLLGKLLFLIVAPDFVSVYGTSGMSGAAMTAFGWQLWAVKRGSLEQRAVATTVAATAWGLTTINIGVVYIPHAHSVAGRIVIEYALPLCLLMTIICCVQVLVLVREQITIPAVPEPVAFACFIADLYERVFPLKLSTKHDIVKYIDYAYETWCMTRQRR